MGIIEFIEHLTLTGRYVGQPFILREWQKDILRKLFATDADGNRIIRRAMILLGRGNAKTELMAAVVLYCLIFFPPGQEIYSAACDRKQAARIFDSAATMVRFDDELKVLLKIYDGTKRIVNESRHSFYAALSSEGSLAHSMRPTVVIYEEVARAKNQVLWDALTTGLVKCPDPLWITTTTAGLADPHHVAYQEFLYAKSVEEGATPNPAYLPALFYATDEDDWESEETWKKVNPALGDFISLETMREEFHNAKDIPARQAAFKMDHLNMWLGAASKWLDMSLWDLCDGDTEVPEQAECFAGLDKAPVRDLSSLCLLFRIDDRWKVKPFFWCCERDIDIRSKRDHVPYRHWMEIGLLKATPGSSTDFNVINNDILELSEKYRIKLIGADRQFAYDTGQYLQEHGIPVEWYSQGFTSMNPACLKLEKLLIDRELNHGGHPLLRWCAANAVTERNSSGLIRPVKEKSTERIDGLVALLMGIGATLAESGDGESWYESHKIEWV